MASPVAYMDPRSLQAAAIPASQDRRNPSASSLTDGHANRPRKRTTSKDLRFIGWLLGGIRPRSTSQSGPVGASRSTTMATINIEHPVFGCR